MTRKDDKAVYYNGPTYFGKKFSFQGCIDIDNLHCECILIVSCINDWLENQRKQSDLVFKSLSVGGLKYEYVLLKLSTMASRKEHSVWDEEKLKDSRKSLRSTSRCLTCY